jgi:hypothetical protein
MARAKSGSDDDLPRLAKSEVDARFADLARDLSGLGDDVDVEAELAQAAALADRAPSGTRVEGPRDWFTSEEVEALEDAETRFTPPDPGRVTANADPLRTIAWVLIVGVPVIALIGMLAFSGSGRQFPEWIIWIGQGLFIGGVFLALWRMPKKIEHDPFDDDDGAVV